MDREYLLNRVGRALGHKPVILNRSAAEVKNLALDRRFVYCNVRFFASLRSAQNDTGMIIWLPHNIEMIRHRPVGLSNLTGLFLLPQGIVKVQSPRLYPDYTWTKPKSSDNRPFLCYDIGAFCSIPRKEAGTPG